MMRAATTITAGVLGAMLCAAPMPALADDALAELREANTALRLELANTRLQLREAVADLEDTQRFLKEQDLSAVLAEWREERQRLAQERAAIRAERERLEAERRALLRQATELAEQREQREQARQRAAEQAVAPQWHADYVVGVIPLDGETVYVKPVAGDVLVERFPRIDRENVMMRGTFENRSDAPWRYTFEVRIAGRPVFDRRTGEPNIVGTWRYQTPLLSPGELHQFEVKVPVTDVNQMTRYEIGNVTADRPVPAVAQDRRSDG